MSQDSLKQTNKQTNKLFIKNMPSVKGNNLIKDNGRETLRVTKVKKSLISYDRHRPGK